MAEFRMPSLGADMTEGTLLEWLVKPGDYVHRGDIVAVVDTDKAAIEVEVFEDGVVRELLVRPGTRIPVGTPLALIDGAGAEAAVPADVGAVVAAPAPEPQAREPEVATPLVRHLAHSEGVELSRIRGTGEGGVITRADVAAAAHGAHDAPSTAVRASPLARRRAAERGIDLTSVQGTGPSGAVLVEDVEQAAGATALAQHAEPRAPSQRSADRAETMRHAIGDLMARSKREVPHYYLSTDIDMSKPMEWLRSRNVDLDVGSRLVPAALLLKAAAVATRDVPEVNGWWVDGQFEPSSSVHLGVAIALRPTGLIAPAILDAAQLDLDTLMVQLRDLVARARSGRLRAAEMNAGTITVTNLGDQGAGSVFGVIYPPQVALVGFGRITERPWAQSGLLGVRPVVTATLAADHRVSDGHRGGRYLHAIAALLQEPEEL